ncbi:unnamed protein product [Closterium sp. NIES-53]
MGPVVRAAFFLLVATVGLCLVHAADSSKGAETAPVGASAIVVEVPSREVQAHRRVLKKIKVQQGCGQGSGICPYSGVAGCSAPDVFCSGACCTDSAEYPCCGGSPPIRLPFPHHSHPIRFLFPVRSPIPSFPSRFSPILLPSSSHLSLIGLPFPFRSPSCPIPLTMPLPFPSRFVPVSILFPSPFAPIPHHCRLAPVLLPVSSHSLFPPIHLPFPSPFRSHSVPSNLPSQPPSDPNLTPHLTQILPPISPKSHPPSHPPSHSPSHPLLTQISPPISTPISLPISPKSHPPFQPPSHHPSHPNLIPHFNPHLTAHHTRHNPCMAGRTRVPMLRGAHVLSQGGVLRAQERAVGLLPAGEEGLPGWPAMLLE